MNFDVLIPQVWYDFIGRIVPGTYVLIYLLLLRQISESDQTSLMSIIPAELKEFSFFVTFSALTITYLIGSLTGAVWLWCGDRIPTFDRRHLAKVMTEEEKRLHSKGVISHIRFSDCLIPFIYDYIQLQLPKMGARIAKLRGEQHLCGTLFICSVFLGFYTLIVEKQYFLSVLPFAVVLLSAVFYRHLIERAGKAMINGWVFLHNGLSEK